MLDIIRKLFIVSFIWVKEVNFRKKITLQSVAAERWRLWTKQIFFSHVP